MVKSLLGRIGRRGATVVATVALAAAGVGLSAGEASAFGWVTVGGPIIGQAVGVYEQPTTKSWKATGDLHYGDSVDVVCWTTGEDINNQGDVWYRVDAAHYAYTGQTWYGSGYVYAYYVDGGLVWHQGVVPHC
jgi:hypothetical protein